MTFTESVILGIIQGVTEFLPISSSAHLILVPYIFGFRGGDLAYDVALHFATLFATLSLYGRAFLSVIFDLANVGKKDWIKESLLIKILFASIPAFLFGYLFHDYIEKNLRTPYVCAFMLIFVSLLMLYAESKKTERKRDVSYPIAIAIGIAQALALIPGTSRSGITITMGLLFQLDRKRAVDFSFLLSIPVILGASIYELKNFELQKETTTIVITGMVSATFAGIISLKFLINYLRKYTLRIFAWYRIFIALLILMLSE